MKENNEKKIKMLKGKDMNKPTLIRLRHHPQWKRELIYCGEKKGQDIMKEIHLEESKEQKS